MGELRSDIRDLCWQFRNGSISEQEFKDGIRGLLDQYRRTGRTLQNVGLAVQAAVPAGPLWERTWRLLDEVEPRIREAVDNWMSSVPLEVRFHETPQLSKNCAFDGSAHEQDEDCVILNVTGGSDTFRMAVSGQIFHNPRRKDCIQRWARARAQTDAENDSLYVQLVAWADAIRSVEEGYKSGHGG